MCLVFFSRIKKDLSEKYLDISQKKLARLTDTPIGAFCFLSWYVAFTTGILKYFLNQYEIKKKNK